MIFIFIFLYDSVIMNKCVIHITIDFFSLQNQNFNSPTIVLHYHQHSSSYMCLSKYDSGCFINNLTGFFRVFVVPALYLNSFGVVFLVFFLFWFSIFQEFYSIQHIHILYVARLIVFLQNEILYKKL